MRKRLQTLTRITGKLAIALSTAVIILTPAITQADELQELRERFVKLTQSSDFATVFKVGHKLVAMTEAKLGAGHVRHIRHIDRLANEYMYIGMKDKTEALLKKAISLAESKQGKNSVSALESRANLGILYIGLNRLIEAKEQFETAAAISEKVYGADHLETRIMKSNLAWINKRDK